MTTQQSPILVSVELERIARAAGGELRRRFHQPRAIEKKSAIDIVTDADKAAEHLILEQLAARFPGAPVLAEESGNLPGSAGGLRFIVDPLDGTTNYAHGIPHFSTTIAAEDPAGLCAGVIYDPLRDEMYTAIRGGGARCNGELLHVGAPDSLEDAVMATGFPYDIRDRMDEIVGFFMDFTQRVRAVRRFGSAALDLAWVAQGRFDGYWERGLKAWDMAAGVLLVTEAGGLVSNYRGEAVRLEEGECLAAASSIHPRMVEVTRARLGLRT